jgi:proteic killer suppression protein
MYANAQVEKYFSDYSKLKKKLPEDWVHSIKKHMNHLAAAETFGDFLKLGLGRPEQLSGYEQIRYSLRVSKNVRLIIEPNATQDTIMICSEIEVEGVSDYHGGKENWYVP